MILTSTIHVRAVDLRGPRPCRRRHARLSTIAPSVTSGCGQGRETVVCSVPMVVFPALRGKSLRLRRPLIPRSEQELSLNVSLCGLSGVPIALRDAGELRYNCLIGDNDPYLAVGIEADGGEVLRANEGALSHPPESVSHASCRVSAGATTRQASRARPGAQILDLLWQGTTWKHGAILTQAQDIERANRIARPTSAARWTAKGPAVSAPLPTYGTRLRGIRFIESHSSSRLVIQLLDELAGTSGAHLLGLYSPDALSSVVKRLPYIARRIWEGSCHLARGFVAQIANTSLRLIQHSVFASL